MKSRRGEIIKVADLFDKYKKVLKAPQSSVIKEVIEVISDITGVTLSPKFIKYTVHSRTVSITAPAVVKQEIKLHQDEIIIHLTARLGEQSVPKILF